MELMVLEPAAIARGSRTRKPVNQQMVVNCCTVGEHCELCEVPPSADTRVMYAGAGVPLDVLAWRKTTDASEQQRAFVPQ